MKGLLNIGGSLEKFELLACSFNGVALAHQRGIADVDTSFQADMPAVAAAYAFPSLVLQ